MLVATCGYLGFVPVAPGTFGSAAGLAMFMGFRAFGSTGVELSAIVALFGIGVWSATVAEGYLGRADPGPVVIDEVVGMLMTLALNPVNLAGAALAFGIFRVLDVAKPWPARRFERLPSGLGVMADDAMVAVYGNVIVRGCILLAPDWLT